MNNNYYKSPESSGLMKMFWKAAGADQYLLERSTYSDQVKYFCLGGIVIATGAMAALAGGYAFYTIFAPKDPLTGDLLFSSSNIILSCIFGMFWGAVIFNIDRFIVTSTGKGDGTEAITKQEIKSAIPRIIMGVIIALTISKPIEIRMFQTEIQTRLTEIKEDKKRDNTLKIESRFKKELEDKDFEINKIENKINEAEQNYKSLVSDVNALVTGTGIYTDKQCTRGENCPTHAQLYISKKSAEQNWINIKESKQGDLFRLKKERANIILRRDKALMYLNINAEGLNGLAIRIKLAEEVAGFWVSLFITLLFMVIELTPIFFKMMLIKGPYDYMDENVKELARAEAGIEIEYDFYKEKDGMEKHKVINHAAEVKMKERLMILKAQEEINERVIQEWKKKKFEDINKNPSSFIDEN
jgi:hypothetical protein